ncbi:MAG: sulfatase, partial [Deltaproteobacteria bacterium]|nr:sulfatase [Deltaproteobacteria bacterium]
LLESLLLSCGSGEPADTRPPDVLLVVLDTVRADRVSSYGYSRATTLQIDAVSKFGVSFDNVITPGSWTYPNHASLFTGEYPWIHGAHLSPYGSGKGDQFDVAAVTSIREDLPTLAEKFSAAGYRTVAISSNEWLSDELGVTRGFDVVKVINNDKNTLDNSIKEIRAEHEDGKPLFLFVNLMPAHSPYYDGPGEFSLPNQEFLDPKTAPEWVRPYLLTGNLKGVELELAKAEGDDLTGQTRFIRGDLPVSPEELDSIGQLYDAGVRISDFFFKTVFTAWAERENESIIVVTSDHGESLGERGHIGHQVFVDPSILRVPLVIVAPSKIPMDIRISQPVQWHDLHPTLLDLAGLEQSDRSLLPLITGEKQSNPVILAKAWKRLEWASLVGGRYQYDWHLYQTEDFALVWNGHDDDKRLVELYDLASDASMGNNIAEAKPEKVTELLNLAKEAFAKEVESEVREISPELRKQLEAMGYIVQ